MYIQNVDDMYAIGCELSMAGDGQQVGGLLEMEGALVRCSLLQLGTVTSLHLTG